MILGKEYLNRAIHGDIVIIEALDQEQSQKARASYTINELTSNTQASDETLFLQRESAPLARVVGIFQRNWKQIVASVSPDENFTSNSNRNAIPFF